MFTLSISSTNKRDHPSIKTYQNQNPYKNKNRGTQVVKLSVPFLFSSAHSAVPEPCVPRSGCRANQNAASCQEKESMEWRNGTERLQTLLFSGATWLDLSNLVARTEYHSRLVLSTLILRFFSQNRCTAGISALFLHSAQRIPLALEENPLVFYCFLKWFLLL